MPGKRTKSADQLGFTLIELMITVLILGILIAIAVPLYSQYVESARRTEARTLLLDTAQQLERCYSTYGAYDDANCGLIGGGGGLDSQIESENGHYVITPGNSNITATTFTLQADAQGIQTDDDCDNYTITQAGTRGVGEGDVDDCW